MRCKHALRPPAGELQASNYPEFNRKAAEIIALYLLPRSLRPRTSRRLSSPNSLRSKCGHPPSLRANASLSVVVVTVAAICMTAVIHTASLCHWVFAFDLWFWAYFALSLQATKLLAAGRISIDMNKISAIICATIIPCLAQGAAVPYKDKFNGATPHLNETPSGWSISNSGTVDIVANGTYGITCRGNRGDCIDLDGSSNKSGEFVSPNLKLTAGETYTATFLLSGNQRITQTDLVTVDFGTASESFSLSKNTPFTRDSISFTAPVTGIYHLSFLDNSNDDRGAILDNVRVVQAVPLPAAAWLLLSGLAGMGMFARRRSRIVRGS